MTMAVPTATTANENDLKLTIVNPPSLGDPSPNGYSTAVITPPNSRVAYISSPNALPIATTESPMFTLLESPI